MGGTVFTVLVDNTGRPGLMEAWGWSVLVEHERGWRILFDSDSRVEVLDYNSRSLGVSLEGLAAFVVSHEHWDHTGGAPLVAGRNPGLPTIVPPGRHDWARGLKLELKVNRDGLDLAGLGAPGALVGAPLEAGGWGLWEEALGVETGEGLVVLVGCSHPGVDRLVEEVLEKAGSDRALLVFGGFHGPDRETLDRLAGLAEYIGPAHCSGWRAVEYVASKYPGRLVRVRTGTRIVVGGGGLRVEY